MRVTPSVRIRDRVRLAHQVREGHRHAFPDRDRRVLDAAELRSATGRGGWRGSIFLRSCGRLAVVRSQDIAGFARRDWDALAASKDEQWLAERRRRGVAWCVRVADDLRRQVLGQRPAWPSPEERDEDLAVHLRVTGALRRVGRASDR